MKETFIETVERHEPLKKKLTGGNQALFTNKKLRKTVYNRSRLKKIFCKHPTRQNEVSYKKQRNKCISLRRKNIKSRNGIITNKNFLSTIKSFLTKKDHINSNEIIVKKGNKTFIEGRELSETFNEHYVNVVENTSGKKPPMLLVIITFLTLTKG